MAAGATGGSGQRDVDLLGQTPTTVSPDHDCGTRLLNNGPKLKRRPPLVLDQFVRGGLLGRVVPGVPARLRHLVQVWRTSSSKLLSPISTVAMVAWAREPT